MSDSGNRLSFLQVSDVRLDARLSFKGLAMNAGKRIERNAEALESFLALCELARERGAQAVFIAGSLFDERSVTTSTVARVTEALAAIGDIPVIICPAQFEAHDRPSFYDAKVLAAHGLRPWSRNVSIQNEPAYCQFGSFTVWCGAEAPPKPAELLSDADYLAFGCTDTYREVIEQGRVCGASSGSLVARSADDTAARSALWVTLTENAAGRASVRIERLPTDKRQIVCVPVSVNGIRPQNLPEHVRKACDASGARPSEDIVVVKLTGIYPAGALLDCDLPELQRIYYHALIEDATRPDYHLDKADARTTEGRFIQILQEMKHKAEAKGGVLPGTEYGGTLSAKTIEDALYYGLDALRQNKVAVKNVD